MDDMVLQVDDLVHPGSELTIFCSVKLHDRDVRTALCLMVDYGHVLSILF